MRRHQEPIEDDGGDPIWILTHPSTLVRFNPGDWRWKRAQYNEIGALLLLAPIDAQRLRSVNLNRLSYIEPRYTPLPRWVGAEPPQLTEAHGARIDINEIVEFLVHPDADLGFDPVEPPIDQITSLYEPWADGRMNEKAAVDFLRSMYWQVHHPFEDGPESEETTSSALAIGMRLVAPVTASPVKTLAAALDVTPNYARQVIHQLRQRGSLPPALREGATT